MFDSSMESLESGENLASFEEALRAGSLKKRGIPLSAFAQRAGIAFNFPILRNFTTFHLPENLGSRNITKIRNSTPNELLDIFMNLG